MKLNGKGEAHARQLIADGKVDRTTSWSFSAEDGNKLLGPNGEDWDNYGRFHLGIDPAAAEKTKARYHYPFGKDGKVYRSGVIAAKQRASQQGDGEIEKAASTLLEKIDGEKDEKKGSSLRRTALVQALHEFSRTAWALQVEWLHALGAALQHYADDGEWDFDRILAARFSSDRAKTRGMGGVAVVPVHGIITQRSDLMNEIFGGGSVPAEQLAALVRELGADSNVSGIVLDVDSPGGSVGGLGELGDAIYSLRGVKPVVAVANPLAASAAYWMGSAASEFTVAPEGQAGSIGVWTAHVDASGMMERLGLKFTLVSAGKYKVEGNPYGPLSDDARGHIQSQVDEYYGMFVKDVARNRKDTQTAVREGYGQGRVLTAKEAVKAKLADRVATLGQVVGEMAAAAGPRPRRASAAELRSRDF